MAPLRQSVDDASFMLHTPSTSPPSLSSSLLLLGGVVVDGGLIGGGLVVGGGGGDEGMVFGGGALAFIINSRGCAGRKRVERARVVSEESCECRGVVSVEEL